MAPKRDGESPTRQSQRLVERASRPLSPVNQEIPKEKETRAPPSPGAWPDTDDEEGRKKLPKPIEPASKVGPLFGKQPPKLSYPLGRDSAPELADIREPYRPSELQRKRTTFNLPDTDFARPRPTSSKSKQAASEDEEIRDTIERCRSTDRVQSGPSLSDFEAMQKMMVKMAERVDYLVADHNRTKRDSNAERLSERHTEQAQDSDPVRGRRSALSEPTPRPRSPTDYYRLNTRHVTPDQSAFGENPVRYVPHGLAARSVFRPYGEVPNPYEPNSMYDRRSKPKFPNPPTFKGKSEEFEPWVRHLVAKLKEDDECFKREDSRMAYVMTLIGDEAERTLAARYDADGFSCLAEMIQVLESTYLDPNQTSTARADLTRLMFKRGSDIHSFISKFNGLVYRARLPKDELKMLLWEHIPKTLDNALLSMAKDPMVSYEVFCNRVTDSAYSDTLAYAERQTERQSGRDRDRERTSRRPERSSPPKERRAFTPYRRPSTPELKTTSNNLGRALSTDERQEHGKTDTCFTCGKTGHYSKSCPTKDQAKGGIRRMGSRSSVSSTSSSEESLKD